MPLTMKTVSFHDPPLMETDDGCSPKLPPTSWLLPPKYRNFIPGVSAA